MWLRLQWNRQKLHTCTSLSLSHTHTHTHTQNAKLCYQQAWLYPALHKCLYVYKSKHLHLVLKRSGLSCYLLCYSLKISEQRCGTQHTQFLFCVALVSSIITPQCRPLRSHKAHSINSLLLTVHQLH